MNPLHLAEIRGARLAWAAVSLTFIVTNAAAALALLVSGSAAAAHPVGPDQASEVDSLVALGGFNAVLVALVALAVIGSATQLVVSSRRGAIARLALAPAELPIGIVTAFLGAPFFLYLLLRGRH